MAGPASLVFTLCLQRKRFLLPPGSRQGLAHRRGSYHTHVLRGAVPTQGDENILTGLAVPWAPLGLASAPHSIGCWTQGSE